MNYKKLLPIMGDNFAKPPMHFPLDDEGIYIELFADIPQADFQKNLDEVMARNKVNWSVSGYLEKRAVILKNYPQMVLQERFYHLGIDINAPCATKLSAPFDSEVVLSEYEQGEGNYGGVIVLKCQTQPNAQPFYLLFGHLNPDSLPDIGNVIKAGEVFAELGNMNQNGNWYYHTHLQVLTQKAFDEGWASKGYCKKSEIATIDEFCPNPFKFL